MNKAAAAALVFALIPAATAGGGEKIFDLCAVSYPSDSKVEWSCHEVADGETPETVFGKGWPDALRFNRMDQFHFRKGMKVKVPKDPGQVTSFTPMPKLLVRALTTKKLILVDQAEQWLGAYEHGKLVLSAPVSLGEEGHRTPNGTFAVTVADRRHRSNAFTLEPLGVPYPMNYALHFYTDDRRMTYWIHGRDLSGVPESHGCIGLYDEGMQKQYFGKPSKPCFEDAKALWKWVTGSEERRKTSFRPADPPQVEVINSPPR